MAPDGLKKSRRPSPTVTRGIPGTSHAMLYAFSPVLVRVLLFNVCQFRHLDIIFKTESLKHLRLFYVLKHCLFRIPFHWCIFCTKQKVDFFSHLNNTLGSFMFQSLTEFDVFTNLIIDKSCFAIHTTGLIDIPARRPGQFPCNRLQLKIWFHKHRLINEIVNVRFAILKPKTS